MVCAVGVYSAESILTMPVVTTLFRNLFDNIFTIFYGCWTVFNGVGPLLTLATPFEARFIWLDRFYTVQQPLTDRDSLSDVQCPPCVTLVSTAVPGSLVLSVYVCALCYVYVCVLVLVYDLCACVSTSWF